MFPDKKRFLSLLLLADEREDVLDRYLEHGEMFTLYDGGKLRAACVVTNEEEDTYELKDIVIYQESQRKSYDRYLVEFLFHHYSDRCSAISVGTDNTPHPFPFYQSCGFTPFRRVENSFTDRHDHPICEDEILLRDVVHLKREKL